MTYRATLRSSRWAALKWRAMLQAGFSCESCGRTYCGPRQGAGRFFNLHHRHYETVGRELFEDVAVLCRVCHEAEHGLLAPPILSAQPTGRTAGQT